MPGRPSPVPSWQCSMQQSSVLSYHAEAGSRMQGICAKHHARGHHRFDSMGWPCCRDYVLETLFFVAVLMGHLSRWAEDLIIYSSGLFKFVQCSDAYATGAALHATSRKLRQAHGLSCSITPGFHACKSNQPAGC